MTKTERLLERMKKILAYANSYGYTSLEMDNVWSMAQLAIREYEEAEKAEKMVAGESHPEAELN